MSQPKPPQALIDIQEWFSQAVTEQNTKKRDHHFKEASRFIESSQNLASDERLLVYMNDFWPRCLQSLSDDFQLLKQYLGADKFDSLMKDYLAKYPSSSHTLFDLPQHLLKYLLEHYNEDDRDIIIDIANYEWAYCKSAIAKEEQAFNPDALNEEDKANSLSLPLALQAHVHLIKRAYSANYRNKEISTINKSDEHIVIYRQDYKVKEEEVHPAFYELLNLIKSGQTLLQALESINSSLNKDDTLYVESNIQTWIAFCVQKGLFVQPRRK